ncbi:cytochrome P450 [Podospora didyma]|uniref:Cytochrome P450 n=1 Tax=Podospora didyma TaxID=330526 RepID=A0AAE0U1I9_9PEZI|nr:cytochrome P450 [Podospora didyma]
MFTFLSSLGPLNALALVFGSLTVFYAGRKVLIDNKIRKNGGVRAPILATNPLFGIHFFIRLTYLAFNNRLSDYQDYVYTWATLDSRDLVEISYLQGPEFHKAWSPFLGDSIFTTDGKQWSESRTLIRSMLINDRTIEIMDLFYRMALDITTEFLLGTSVNSPANPGQEFVQAFHEVQKYKILFTALAPWDMVVPSHRYRKGIRTLERFIEPFIACTLALAPEDLEKLSKSDKESTFLHNIARFPRDAKVIRDQILAVLIADVLATCGRRAAPMYEDLKRLSYLTHTLNETLRLHPAVPYNVRAALQDTTLPSMSPGKPPIAVLKGDAVFCSPLEMQRRRDLYPEPTDKFADPAIFSLDRREHWTPKAWHYLPFNGGPRICIGQSLL